MSEALASARFQSVPSTAPGVIARRIVLPSQDEQLRDAERWLREAVRYGAPMEARVRLARVLGRRGRHADAVALLQETVVPAGDVRVAYLRELFLGTEHGALGQVDAARGSLERAAKLFPAAQAPLIAMSDVFRRTGDRAAALEALRRLQALPVDTSVRIDPWWDYYRSYAADAGAQLSALRAWVGRGTAQ
jgi:tetratricopeptide (TPR) repeat protein